ncbi:maleylpyruvate isomerase family mycothiol-dependent enzyme [Streptomyces sp. bgisy100]|uniref:maleylpyruvate isomerase family mycothiol-dependent enzyme n=1 Tax=Streptomyces sp. bgisy100 TaxID=3413783 RepID=UPI003D707C93
MAVTPPLDAVLAAQRRLDGLLDGLTDAVVRAPSALPGWSRAHVLAHLEGVGAALARQARYATRGETVEVYDGGRPARDAAIEAGAERSAEDLRWAVRSMLGSAEEVWSGLGPEQWRLPVRYRDGEVTTALLAWWREVEMHTADLLLGHGPNGWSRAFCAHALDFLAPRAPEGGLTLVAADGPEVRTLGTGERPVTVRGALTDLTAWLAGRVPEDRVDAEPGPLPELRPWP